MENWDDLKFVLAVSRAGGLSGAARALGVNHSTVSRRITAIETAMGVRLFDRLPRGLRPTEAGETAIQSAEVIERQVMDLSLAIAARDEDLAGVIRVTVPPLVVQAHLADVFTEFTTLHPQIDLTILATNETLNLHQREADVAIRVSDTPDETLFGRRVIGQNSCYYVSKRYLEAHQDALMRGDATFPLDYVGFIWWGDNPPEGVSDVFPAARISAKFDDMVAAHAAVKSGLGATRMPCFLGDSDPDLCRLPGFSPQPYLGIWVLTQSHLQSVRRVRLFMSFISQALEGRAALYRGDLDTVDTDIR